MIQRADIIGCGVGEPEAAKLLAQIEALSGTPEARWREAARCILRPDHPFALHQLLYRAIYGSAGGPVFFPEPADIEHAHMTALRRELGLEFARRRSLRGRLQSERRFGSGRSPA